MGEPKHIWLVHLRPQFSELEKLNDASLASASPLHLLGSSRQQPRSWEEDPQKEGMLWTLEVSWCQNLHHNCAKSEPKADYSHLLNPIFVQPWINASWDESVSGGSVGLALSSLLWVVLWGNCEGSSLSHRANHNMHSHQTYLAAIYNPMAPFDSSAVLTQTSEQHSQTLSWLTHEM